MESGLRVGYKVVSHLHVDGNLKPPDWISPKVM